MRDQDHYTGVGVGAATVERTARLTPTWSGNRQPVIHYYPSVDEQRAMLQRYLRGRMYAFFGVIAGCAVFDVVAVWSIWRLF